MSSMGGADDEIRPWINGFVKLVGEDAAKYLLEDAGVIPEEMLASKGAQTNAATTHATSNSTATEAAASSTAQRRRLGQTKQFARFRRLALN